MHHELSAFKTSVYHITTLYLHHQLLVSSHSYCFMYVCDRKVLCIYVVIFNFNNQYHLLQYY